MIEVKNLTKNYGTTPAVDDVSFKIRDGRIYGFLGPNGAGKSTTMNIISGCLAASSGSVIINGYDIAKNPIEAKKQIREIMEQTGIAHMKDRLIGSLSKGYKQRVGIAQAMLGNPDVIILDEPTVGLDPQQIIEIRELIRTLGQNKTVILSSHILAEISEVCDHIIIISRGKIVADSSLEELEARISDQTTLRMSIKGNKTGILEIIDRFPGVRECTVLKDSDGMVDLELKLPRGTDIRDDLFFAMAEKRFAVVNIEQITASLEEVFLSLTDRTQGTPDKRALREKKRREKILGNVGDKKQVGGDEQ